MKTDHLIEVEIKTLLGSPENAQKVIEQLKKRDKHLSKLKSSKQLNHYFINGNFEALLEKVTQHIPQKEIDKLTQIVKAGKKHSVRTRKKNEEVILVVKATVDETNSSNGTARMEYEVSLEKLDIHQLDKLLLDAEFKYQAKWSRDREEYKYKDYVVSIDKNAGYGYLAEFERVVEDMSHVDSVKQAIRDELTELGLDELAQDRLDRMFSFYNENWPQYYGTDKTFNIK